MNYKRITIFAGHYGSGKTNIAINAALEIKKSGKDVCIADLDIVNPYYRTKDSEDMLEKAGIHLISSPYANSNVDVPALPDELYSMIDRRDRYAVLDVGGDDRGALALGRFSDAIKTENNYEMLCVLNFFRPLTNNASDALEVMREIEAACRVPFTGIVNNSNLGVDTTAEDVKAAMKKAEELSELASLPIVATCAKASIAAELSDNGSIMPLTLQDIRLWNTKQ